MIIDQRVKLKQIKRFDQLIVYLRDEMGWPIAKDSFENVDDLFYEFSSEELGIDSKTAAKIIEIKRLRPFISNQPWGIFFVKFEQKKLPVIALRRILGNVALKRRASSNSSERTAWAVNDLLFISNYGDGDERQISFAHFSESESTSELPTLRVLGWNQFDTGLHLDSVVNELTQYLKWPDNNDDINNWRETWSEPFKLVHNEVINTAKDLSIRLAELASAIRARIELALNIENEFGPLTVLLKSFKSTLINDLDNSSFADMYAQTIAYGLLSARITNKNNSSKESFVGYLRTSPFLRELMETFFKIGGRKGLTDGVGIDFDELGVSDIINLLNKINIEAILRDFGDKNRQEDPVMHFFEGFLHAYDKNKRKERGVFYTPQPVVSYIVRNVHEQLQNQFGLEDGLADISTWADMLKKHPVLKLPLLTDDENEIRTISPSEPFVQILDPSTGTSTFLVEVIDVIYNTLIEKWTRSKMSAIERIGAWNKYVPLNLLPRLYGFELMMAPYAIAHMKIGLKLAETGYLFESEEPARIFLTNSLEPWLGNLPSSEFNALSNESISVNKIKANKRFTVVIGNPPYSVSSQNKGKYIENLMILYKKSIKSEKNIQPLSDDYIKFIRLSQKIIDLSGLGIIGLITNNSYLSGLIHRGVREELLKSFNHTFILDLHGNSVLSEMDADGISDENIFDIRQGVSIIFLIKDFSNLFPEVHYLDIIGKASKKYQNLKDDVFPFKSSNIINSLAPNFFFIPKSIEFKEEYDRGWGIDEIFVKNISGIKTHRDDFVFDLNRDSLEERILNFRNSTLDDNYFRNKYGLKESATWNIKDARTAIRKDINWRNNFHKCMYRPFDIRYLYYSDDLIDRSRKSIMSEMVEIENNIALLAMRQVAVGDEFNHFGVTKWMIDNRLFFSNRGIVNIFPLYLKSTSSDNSSIISNLNSNFISSIEKKYNLKMLDYGVGNLINNIGPRDVLNYLYAIFYSDIYRVRFNSNLRDDFPKIPFANNFDIFKDILKIGEELVLLHILESKINLKSNMASYPVDGNNTVDNVVFQAIDGDINNYRIYINSSQFFDNIPKEVCEIKFGGYRVCEKWLKDRKGFELSMEDINLFSQIIHIFYLTKIKTLEIDRIISSNGGWHDTFN